MALAVTHTKTLIAPDSGSADKVYGSDYVSPTSHSITGAGTMAVQNASAVAITGGAAALTRVVLSQDLSYDFSALSMRSATLGFDGAATLGGAGAGSYFFAEDPTVFAAFSVQDTVQGGFQFLGLSSGANSGVIISGIFAATPASGIAAVTIIGAGPPTAVYGQAAGQLSFAVQNDFGPNQISVVEKHFGYTDSVGALGVNTDIPGAIFHVKNPLPGSLHDGYDPTAQIVAIVEGVVGQVADLQQWKVNGGSALTKIGANGDLSVPDEAYGAGWNGSLEVPTKNAVYDKIETLGGISLAADNTWTGVQQFGTIGGAVGKLSIAGSTSGSSILNAAAVAGTTTITLPGVTSTLSTLGLNVITRLQTITQGTANEGILKSTGGSNTGSDTTSALDFAWTLNTSGSPDVFALRVTDTARGSSTRLFNIYAGASGTTSVFTVDRFGNTRIQGGLLANNGVSGSTTCDIGSTDGGVALANNSRVIWSSTSSSNGTADLFVIRSAAAILQQGAANAASPVAQTFQSQGSRSGTDSNVAGGTLTIRPGAGTGNATPGALKLQSYVAVASGTGAQTATDSITVSLGGATIGVGGLTFPAADPLIAGRWWDNAGTLTKSAG